jgi:hypothetical protein
MNPEKHATDPRNPNPAGKPAGLPRDKDQPQTTEPNRTHQAAPKEHKKYQPNPGSEPSKPVSEHNRENRQESLKK